MNEHAINAKITGIEFQNGEITDIYIKYDYYDKELDKWIVAFMEMLGFVEAGSGYSFSERERDLHFHSLGQAERRRARLKKHRRRFLKIKKGRIRKLPKRPEGGI